MKRSVMVFLVAALIVVGFSGNGMAGGSVVPAPVLDDGRDVLIPDALIQAIPGYDANKPVYAAWSGNGWFKRGPAYATSKAVEASVMTKEGGGFWRAKGMAGKRFHPVQLDSEKRPIWALIEEIWPGLGESFIDRSNIKGPCLKLTKS